MNREDDYQRLADRYFDFLAGNFPVLCASDEFDFFPRVANAARHYDRLEKLDASAIEEFIDTLKGFQKSFAAHRSHLKNRILVPDSVFATSKARLRRDRRGGAEFQTAGNLLVDEDLKRGTHPAEKAGGPKDIFEMASNNETEELDRLIDLKLLEANTAGILIELDTKRSWRFNPLLYLKIGFIGLDHALNKPAREALEVQERSLARLCEIPGILKNGMDNIQSVPEAYYQASLRMVQDCGVYLNEIGNKFLKQFADESDTAFKVLKTAADSLESFNRFLKSKVPEPDRRFAVSTLEASLKDHFLSSHEPEEIFAIASEEWHEILGRLDNLQSRIDSAKTWTQLYHGYTPSKAVETGIIDLYEDEIKRLRTFFSQKGFSDKFLASPVEIKYTPTYLNSVRSSASFAAAFSRDERERSYFYISTDFPQHNSKETDHHLQRRLNREYKMLTAHETIPGHHFLDSFRRRLTNPIRRQIESPLFYEGWASYAESMLIESGYLEDPLELLVSLKRDLWRSARCQIDVGFTIGKLSEDSAVELLTTCGFAAAEASRQLDRFRLNPGYQLCYCYGSHEFKRLKTNYGHLLEGQDFYSFLLEGGELPFHLIERRFKKLRNRG